MKKSIDGLPLRGYLEPPKLNRQSRRRLLRWGLVTGNLCLLLAIAVFIIVNRAPSQTIRAGTVNSAIGTASSVQAPLDQVSSAQIAQAAAQMTQIPELTAVTNQADSERALLSIVPSDATVISKPQVVTTAQKSKYDIQQYKVQPGEDANSIANKFHLTVGSITGSNGLRTTAISPGTVIFIPPGNGLVYKILPGDTVDSIVGRFGADKNLFVSVNDAESGLNPGDRIWIPNVVAPVSKISTASYIDSFSPTYGYNGYDYGFCTWYVASVIPVPSNWGNASTWDDYARRTPGWVVDVVPRVGAIAQTDLAAGGEGHVAIVTDVSADGTMIKYSDMNGLAGWGNVGHTPDFVSASRFQHYIYRSQ